MLDNAKEYKTPRQVLVRGQEGLAQAVLRIIVITEDRDQDVAVERGRVGPIDRFKCAAIPSRGPLDHATLIRELCAASNHPREGIATRPRVAQKTGRPAVSRSGLAHAGNHGRIIIVQDCSSDARERGRNRLKTASARRSRFTCSGAHDPEAAERPTAALDQCRARTTDVRSLRADRRRPPSTACPRSLD